MFQVFVVELGFNLTARWFWAFFSSPWYDFDFFVILGAIIIIIIIIIILLLLIINYYYYQTINLIAARGTTSTARSRVALWRAHTN